MSSLATAQRPEQLDVEVHLSRSRPALLLQCGAVVLQGLESGSSYGNQRSVRGAALPLPLEVGCAGALDLQQECSKGRGARRSATGLLDGS